MIKRIVTIVIAAVMILSLSACGFIKNAAEQQNKPKDDT